ncbi:zinc finger protein 280C isoform X2 [Corythoichthys intestinalis]|uniref:zinc finger protein 280C isoform X2 n=1 Tax=Corythoichthys intestinalis TaxID=161448 RepID=UPI0025A55D4F|nr:zinc finger protein 280C isoform X2 [Corythoichthys intestinalis]XP_061796165.1 zinc finger protein 280C-like [Nerophis lumbriciformis]
MSELFMECEEEELEPWQRAAPEQIEEEEDDDDEPIFVGVVAKKEKEVPPIPPIDNVEKYVVNSAPPTPTPVSPVAPSSIMLPLKISGNAASAPRTNIRTVTPQPVIVNNQGFIVTPPLTSNNDLVATLGKHYPPGTKFTIIPAPQSQQLIQHVTPVTAIPGVVHRPHVQQIQNNVVTLANVQSPTVYTAKPQLLQVNQGTSLQTISLPVKANKETVKRVVPPNQMDTDAKRFKADVSFPVGQGNTPGSLENGEAKRKCPNCNEDFIQLNRHLASCKARTEGGAVSPPADNAVLNKRIMLVSDFYYGRFEGNCPKVSAPRSDITFKCQSCLKVLKSNIKFMNHMKHHLELEKQSNESLECHTTCQHCYRQYMTPFQLQCHIESAHSPIESSTNCKICELAFESEQVLLEHMKDNHKPGEMPYVCQVCNYRSSFFSEVETHFRSVHVNTKNLLCPFCLRVLRSSQRYMQHFMKHQRKGIHRCGKCRLNFLTHKDRLDHRAQVHKTFRKPLVLEGLPAGTKVTIRASLSGKKTSISSLLDPSAIIFTPEMLSNNTKTKPTGGCGKSKRNSSEVGKAKTTQKKKGHATTNCNMSLKSLSVNGGCYTCIECNNKVDEFFSHFLFSSVCGACTYRTSCKIAIGNHMIRYHSMVNKSRFSKVDHKKHSSAMKLTLVCLNCDLLVDASGGDVMSKHLNERPNHVCKVIEEKGLKASTGVQDSSDSIQMKRKELLPQLKEAQERGEIAILRHDQLIILTPLTPQQSKTETSEEGSSKLFTVVKELPTETSSKPEQFEKTEDLSPVTVEHPPPEPVLQASVEDSPEKNATVSGSSAVEVPPGSTSALPCSIAAEDSLEENATVSGSSAVEVSPGSTSALPCPVAAEDSLEENATVSGSSAVEVSSGGTSALPCSVAAEDSLEENATVSGSSAVEVSPRGTSALPCSVAAEDTLEENVTVSSSSAVEVSPGGTSALPCSIAAEDSLEENASRSDSSPSCTPEGFEDVKPIEDTKNPVSPILSLTE